jgi:hypothetical protein
MNANLELLRFSHMARISDCCTHKAEWQAAPELVPMVQYAACQDASLTGVMISAAAKRQGERLISRFDEGFDHYGICKTMLECFRGA